MLTRISLLLTIIFVSVLGWYFQAMRPVQHESTPDIEFQIESGQVLDEISQNLSDKHLIRSRLAFKITVIRLGLTNKIQAGYFYLSPNQNIQEIANQLTKAYSKQIRITLPEGLRREEIAKILSDSFSSKTSESNFDVSEFLKLTQKMEGQLFPDTYDFNPEDDTQTVVNKLNGQYQSVLSELGVPESDQSRVTIVASLLEREAANNNEMSDIAGVINNRLNAGWPLQIDATVQYALANSTCKGIDCDWWPESLTKDNLQINSPLNTYLHPGLPSAPISNPGKSSLAAANHPQTNNYWFYLHDSSGLIHFAHTLEMHNQNICQYLHKDCQ